MKNILFISRYLIGNQKDNLYTKFTGQIKALENLGYNVWYTGIENNILCLINCDNKIVIGEIGKAKVKSVIFQKMIFYNDFYKLIYNKLNASDYNFDLSYIRNMFFCPSSIRLLKFLAKSKVKNIMEIPTYPPENEYKMRRKSLSKFILLFQNKLTRIHARYIDLYVVIGEKAEKKYHSKDAINIENGIFLDQIPQKIGFEEHVGIHILALATVAYWHGYDRLIKSLYKYYTNGGDIEVTIHLVGNDGDGSLLKLKNMVYEYNMEKHVIFEGYKTGEDLQKIVNKCDIAVSSLALFRKKIYVSSELKTREYMGRGIPFIYSSHDEMLIDVDRFCHKVNNSEDTISFEDIFLFTNKVRADKNLIEDMRGYANKHMTWQGQFSTIEQRLNLSKIK